MSISEKLVPSSPSYSYDDDDDDDDEDDDDDDDDDNNVDDKDAVIFSIRAN